MKTTSIVINHDIRHDVVSPAPQQIQMHECSVPLICNKLKKLSSSDTQKSIYLRESNSSLNLINKPSMDRVLTDYVPTSTNSPSVYSSSPQIWIFNFSVRELHNTTTRIQLTAIESLLIKTLIMSTSRVCSKIELIIGIDKNPHSYSGLEMSLSRLQHKFKCAFDERLFRSVRNRGYCLVQDVRSIDDTFISDKKA